MVASSQTTLPGTVWPSKSLPAPPTADAVSHVADFLHKLGYLKTIKALVKEAQSHDITLDPGNGMIAKSGPLGRPLGDMYVDAFLQEDDEEEEVLATTGAVAAVESETSDSESESDESEDDSSDSDSSDDESVATQVKITAPPATLKRKRDEVDSDTSSSESESDSEDSEDLSSDSESDSSDAVEPPTKKAKQTSSVSTSAVAPGKMDVDTEDTSEDTSDSESEVSDSSDDSSSEEETSADSDSVSATSEDSDSDSDSEEEASATSTPTPTRKDSGKKNIDSHLSDTSAASSATMVADEHAGMHPSRANRLEKPKQEPTVRDQKKSNVPFSRIPKDTYVDPRFSSNGYVSYDYADRAHNDLIVTRGKGFTKEKNKKKRGSYKGGWIDTAPKGIKFED